MNKETLCLFTPLRDKKTVIAVALGSNSHSAYGAPMATLRAALHRFPAVGLRVVAISRFYASPAWPDPRDPPFVNAVALVDTAMDPAQLLATLHAIERGFGRERYARNAPRTLDLDLIDYRGRVQSAPGGPDLPHPRAHERAFVLAPLLDVAPDWTHPRIGRRGKDLLTEVHARGLTATPLD